jgi:hypothetical protein
VKLGKIEVGVGNFLKCSLLPWCMIDSNMIWGVLRTAWFGLQRKEDRVDILKRNLTRLVEGGHQGKITIGIIPDNPENPALYFDEFREGRLQRYYNSSDPPT